MKANPRKCTTIYPYEDGDTTVLGPGIFAAKDGSVINWYGENYVPQKGEK